MTFNLKIISINTEDGIEFETLKLKVPSEEPKSRKKDKLEIIRQT